MEKDQSQKFKLALIQMAMNADPKVNLERAIAFIHSAASSGANAIVLPELFRSLYFCQREDETRFELAEAMDGSSVEALRPLAKKHQVTIVVPIFERRSAGLYHNSLVVIDADGSTAGQYRKMHIPDDPGFYEKYYFTPGDLGYQAVQTKFANLGTLICWDQWFPEAARLTALKGAEILIYPTAIGWLPSEKNLPGKVQKLGQEQYEAWLTVQRGHAIANGVFVAAVNRVGVEKEASNGLSGGDEIEFWGQSFVADPAGAIVAQASAENEEILITEIDLSDIEITRRTWPFLRDRRIETFDDLSKRFND